MPRNLILGTLSSFSRKFPPTKITRYMVVVKCIVVKRILYLLDQTPLLISCHSQIVATPPDVLNEIVAALEY